MDSNLKVAFRILRQLSDNGVEKALQALQEIKESEKRKDPPTGNCPHCGSGDIVRNGHKHNKQAYICRGCGKSFVETTKTAIALSHSGEAVWKNVIRDTINGIPIDSTACELGLHHETVFNMRHKILYCLEQMEIKTPTLFEGICEMDETYILESCKGSAIPADYWRKPRKHGAKAAKKGLSDEYICICAGVGREETALAMSVNRATAGSMDINKVFGCRIGGKTVIMADGSKGYGVLEASGKCVVLNVKEALAHDAGSAYNINTVNNFHNFIKERNRKARGFATKYINRYNSLFSKVFRSDATLVDYIYNVMSGLCTDAISIAKSQTDGLLVI